MLSWGRKGVVKLGSVGKNGSTVSKNMLNNWNWMEKLKGIIKKRVKKTSIAIFSLCL